MSWVMVRVTWGAKHMAELAAALGETLDMAQCSELQNVPVRTQVVLRGQTDQNWKGERLAVPLN